MLLAFTKCYSRFTEQDKGFVWVVCVFKIDKTVAVDKKIYMTCNFKN
jgi:hypothetical protein